ncbi:hypothetical protein K505DRAFT_337608 [Melanomma pulvis-pyrius CBS 109.77]|uniref:Uncharacterized protein n=1 Tax=Melanomma pulvis-pyrius CBS 109.77 TaxID=1314802 RepID=A0A6A6XB91_9PLEO|nr:hypothetical protein K505DRAFT_337608 [Melanomma pulvis-pyrius CBS 109.77]
MYMLPHLTRTYVRQTVPMYGEISKAFSLLEEHPARNYSIPCANTVEVTRVWFGNNSYITGLFDKPRSNSETIKLHNEKPKYVEVWVDKIGIRDIKFLNSETSQDSVQLEPKWVYTFPFTGNIHVKSKGVFIERIAGSTINSCRTLWNSSKSPLIFEQEPFVQMTSQPKEYFVRFVPLHHASAISVGFLHGAMVAIVSHGGTNYDLPHYIGTWAAVIWAHFPLLLDKGEEIHEVWSVSHRDLNQGTRALVLRTQRKLVWLGHYISTEIWSLLQVTHIASSPVSALYYSDPSTSFSQIMQPHTIKRVEHPAQLEFPTYRTPVPGHGMDTCELFYSEAPLEGVIQVQSCWDTGRCIGLLLQYERYSQTVGEFRYDKTISDYFHLPCSIGLTQKEHDSTSYVHIEFSKEIAQLDSTGDDQMMPMRGIVVWWYSRNMSVVSIILPE